MRLRKISRLIETFFFFSYLIRLLYIKLIPLHNFNFRGFQLILEANGYQLMPSLS